MASWFGCGSCLRCGSGKAGPALAIGGGARGHGLPLSEGSPGGGAGSGSSAAPGSLLFPPFPALPVAFDASLRNP
eukprot:1604543-Heterocapsa_arctica.AAC.1